MEKALEEYTKWRNKKLPEDLSQELESIKNDKNAIYDAFCRQMVFGTSGLRGKMGAGTNRINSIVLRKASLGICEYLKTRTEKPSLIIGYDTRINSPEYAEGIARVFASKGIDVYLFSEATPVPVLSFAIRNLKINGGVMITASHNTKIYNGYKVYDHCGNQVDDKKAKIIEEYMSKADPFDWIPVNGNSEQVHKLSEQIKEAYLEALKAETLWWSKEADCKKALSKLNVCYTPLNGTGRDYVVYNLKRLGVGEIIPVKSQWEHDGSFPTCPSPNPEYEETFSEALNCAHMSSSVDLIIATDPDSDRLGVMTNEGGNFVKLSGNQVGELMTDYILRCYKKGACGKSLTPEKTVFKSYVSSPLVEKMCTTNGIKFKNVYTGFKNIAFQMEKLATEGHTDDFIFGFEESLGYLYGNFTRDKDGIMAAQMVCLMAAEMKSQGKTLGQRLEEIYQTYGHLNSTAFSLEYDQEKKRRKIEKIIKSLFNGNLKKRNSIFKIEKEVCVREKNMYTADLLGGHRIIIRPSGTELKIKAYIFAEGKTDLEAEETGIKIKSWIEEFFMEEG